MIGSRDLRQKCPNLPAVAVVLPSLNEESTLRDTCESLGFLDPTSEVEPTAFLFIVDNGSTDNTLEVARKIQREALPGAVFLGHEKEKGYVPPRRTGNLLVKAFAEEQGLPPAEILILQADADTYYEPGFLEHMREASAALGPNCLLEGIANFPPSFRDTYPEYVRICETIDARVLSTLEPLRDSEVICTDAVSAYRLSDYFSWGGHLREFRTKGDEIHAETTRLFMRSLPHGSRKAFVDTAIAYPSERKFLEQPLEELATAGFPRERSWRQNWERLHPETTTISNCNRYSHRPAVDHAAQVREKHLIALFGILPLHVARALGIATRGGGNTPMRRIADALPKRSAVMLAQKPGIFLSDVLGLVDQNRLSDVLPAWHSGEEYRRSE